MTAMIDVPAYSATLRGQVGDSFDAAFRYLRYDPNEGFFKPVDLTSATYRSKIRLGPHKRSSEAPTAFVVATQNAKRGTLTAKLPATHPLVAGTYHFELDVVIGDDVSTVAKGTLEIKETLI